MSKTFQPSCLQRQQAAKSIAVVARVTTTMVMTAVIVAKVMMALDGRRDRHAAVKGNR